MNTRARVVLFAAAGLIFMTSRASLAQTSYDNDLVFGITPDTSNNSLVYDLGSESTLTNGESWSLGSILANFNLSTSNWGVVGAQLVPPSSTRTLWTTFVYANAQTGGENGPTPIPSVLHTSGWNTLHNEIAAVYQYMPTAAVGQFSTDPISDQASWNFETISGNISNCYCNSYLNPNQYGTGTSIQFWQVVANGSAPTVIGSFELGSDGTLTFNTVPAPSGAVLLLVGAAVGARRRRSA